MHQFIQFVLSSFAMRFMVPTTSGWEGRGLVIDNFSDYYDGTGYFGVWVRGRYPNLHSIYYHEDR